MSGGAGPRPANEAVPRARAVKMAAGERGAASYSARAWPRPRRFICLIVAFCVFIGFFGWFWFFLTPVRARGGGGIGGAWRAGPGLAWPGGGAWGGPGPLQRLGGGWPRAAPVGGEAKKGPVR